MEGVRIGEVTHYFDRIGVAVIQLTDSVRVGDTVHIFGRLTDLRQQVSSMEIEYEKIDEAGPGQEVALKVNRPVKPRDKVFKLATAR
jgi:acyl-CoA hydrolase